jgi:tellurite resistance protein
MRGPGNGENEERSMELTVEEAGMALATLIAFSDGDPSDAEQRVIREYFTAEQTEALRTKMKSAGYTYPEELTDAWQPILEALRKTDRDKQLHSLAVVYQVACADGVHRQEELLLLKTFSEQLSVNLSDIETYFPA